MSVRLAWKHTTIANKLIAASAAVSLVLSGLALFLSHNALLVSTSQLALENRADRTKNLLEWDRLRIEDDASMPNLVAATIPSTTFAQTRIRILNLGKGESTESIIDDAMTGKDVLSGLTPLQPGVPMEYSIPAANLDKKRLMRIISVSPHGSVRTKTFYFTEDNKFIPNSDEISRSFDFLIADEPGRSNKHGVNFGFGPPASPK